MTDDHGIKASSVPAQSTISNHHNVFLLLTYWLLSPPLPLPLLLLFVDDLGWFPPPFISTCKRYACILPCLALPFPTQTITLLFAGQDTTAATLSWTMHLLSLPQNREYLLEVIHLTDLIVAARLVKSRKNVNNLNSYLIFHR